MAKAQRKTTATEPRPACADQYFGHWLIQSSRLTERLEMFKAGAFKPAAQDGQAERPAFEKSGNIAVIPIHGEMMKGDSSFGGTVSTVRVRKAVRAAAADSTVRGIMLHIDSPGGTVAGTSDLADDILAAQDYKPVHAYVADLGASAAYWVASQSARLSTGRASLVGSLGTVATLVDESGMLDKMGIKVTTVSTGAHKGAGFDGKVTEGMVEETQRIVDGINEHFIAAVRDGRGFSDEQTRALFDGRVHVGTEAQRLGLVDSVSSFDEAMGTLISEVQSMDAKDFAAYAAQNPDALKAAASGLTDAAKTEGYAEGERAARQQAADTLAIEGIDLTAAAKHIAAGSSKAQVLGEVNKSLSAKLAAAEAKAAAPAQQNGVPFVPAADAKPEPSVDGDPKARAEWEWDNGKTAWKASSKDRYVAGRIAELSGKLKLAR